MADVWIIGGGYAGVHAARTAARAGARVTIVDPTGRHDLLPRLAAVAAGRRPVGDAWAPLEDMVDGEVRRARATLVEVDGPTVVLDDGTRHTPGAVVVTVGAVPALPPVEGIERTDALTLTDARGALRLRTALEEAEALTVVGAGATGVQLAAEVAGRHPHLPVRLVEAGPRLLPQLDRRLGRRAGTILRRRGVDVRTDVGVVGADQAGVTLADGTRLDGLVVWATGVRADGHALLPHAPTSEGRLLVDRALRVAGRVLAAGDVAAQRDVFGNVTAPSAQIALQAGRIAGRNAAAIAAGRMPRPAQLFDLGWVVDLGGRAVAQVGPLSLHQPLVDRVVPAMHEVIDLRHLWQAGGATAVIEHATGQHDPSDAAVRRAERPPLRAVS